MDYILFGHGGSGNHGCEAIVRTTLEMLKGAFVSVYSADVEKDRQFGIDELADFHQYRSEKNSFVGFYTGKIIYKLTGNYDVINKFALKDALKVRNCICMSVGGDNYCNAEPARHASRNKLFSKNNKTILWGCSVTPSLLDNQKYIEDMELYSLITARESITYHALINAGLTNVKLVSDPAFTLTSQEIMLPELFLRRKVVGINISPLVMKYEQGANILLSNIEKLIRFILRETDFGIALIPHVLLKYNNDLVPLKILYDKFKDTERLCLIDYDDSLNCCELKYVISHCAFMVAARTHASIAAYSTSVPTLVLGYSVKSQGIATDIFGSPDHYVLPVDQIKNESEVTQAFKWVLSHEAEIREHYKFFMPAYIQKAFTGNEFLLKL